VIENNQKLQSLLSSLQASPWVALDTEADSLHAYPEKLCLLQIAAENLEELVDTLADMDLVPLWKTLGNRELILHGSDYDLRLFKKNHGFVPREVFDTMIASRLVGCRQFGLTDLVFKYLGVTLEKGPQKANWARRPLTPRMETYALNDVRYLNSLANILKSELKEKGRLGWHEESCRKLVIDSCNTPDPDPDMVWRVKGSHQLSPESLAVLKEIWHWREIEATHANKPPYFVLTPEIMVNLSMHAFPDPRNPQSAPLERLLPPRMSPRRRQSLLQAIQRGKSAPSLPRLKRNRGHRPPEAEQNRFQNLEKHRNNHAQALDIDPTLIASRATLMALALNWDKASQDLMSWQLDLLKA